MPVSVVVGVAVGSIGVQTMATPRIQTHLNSPSEPLRHMCSPATLHAAPLHAGAIFCSNMAGYAIDLTVVLAEFLRQNRLKIEK